MSVGNSLATWVSSTESCKLSADCPDDMVCCQGNYVDADYYKTRSCDKRGSDQCMKVLGVNNYLPIELVIIGVMLILLITVYSIKRCIRNRVDQTNDEEPTMHISNPDFEFNREKLVHELRKRQELKQE